MTAWTSEVVSANGYHTHSVCLLVILVEWGILVCFYSRVYSTKMITSVLTSDCVADYDILVS